MHDRIIAKLKHTVMPPEYGSDAYKSWLDQESFLSLLQDNQEDPYIILYTGVGHSVIFPIIVPLHVLDSTDKGKMIPWDYSPFNGWIMNYNHPLKERGDVADVWLESPLRDSSSVFKSGDYVITFRDFAGKLDDKNYYELNQKISHSLNIHYVPELKAYCQFDEHGDREEVVKSFTIPESKGLFGGNVIVIKKAALENYLIASKSALVRLFDSTRIPPEDFQGWEGQTEREVLANPTLGYKLGRQGNYGSYMRGYEIFDIRDKRDQIIGRINGLGEVKEYATYTCFDRKTNKVIEWSCDPDQLDSYFEETGKPWQITPVFFKPEVLSKYKADPDKYKLDQRSILCRESWHLETYDVNEVGQVHTYLRYLSYLPYTEQLHWKQYNEPPKGPISKRAVQTDLIGDFHREYDPLQSLKGIINELKKKEVPWWTLKDKGLLDRLNDVVSNSEKEWRDEILTLDQMLVEGFKQSYLRGELSKVATVDPKWGSMKLMEELLQFKGMAQEDARELIRPLRVLHDLKSKIGSHVGGEEAKGIKIEIIKVHGSYKKHFSEMLKATDHTMRTLLDIGF